MVDSVRDANASLSTEEANSILKLQADVLESIATGDRLNNTLDQVCALVQGLLPGAVCSTMLLSSSGELNVAAAPAAPQQLIEALNGLVPSDMAGSCGTAVFQKRPVYVRDTSSDPRWAKMQEIAQKFDIESCWSVPILSANGAALGSFAISHLQKCEPTSFHKDILMSASHLVGIALQKDQADRERDRLERQNSHKHKMEAVGQLSAGIAHEFNNLLVAMLGSAEMLLGKEPLPLAFEQPLHDIKLAAERAAGLTRQLLTFSRKKPAPGVPMDVNQTVGETESILRQLSGPAVQLTLNLASDLPAIQADPAEIQQIMMNLVINARDAMPEGGRVTIETAIEELETGSLPERSGPRVKITVTDDGAGIPEEHRQRIFEPFFTTKAVGEGTGLGLATVFAIVDRLGGHITVNSTVDVGTRFDVFLPQSHGAISVASVREESSRGGGETILLCDDEDSVRRIMTQQMQEAGYDVLAAHNASSALTLAEQCARKIHVLLTDYKMPDLNGPQLAEQLVRNRPDMAVIYMSGYDESCLEGTAATGAAFLNKPINQQALLACLRSTLNAGLPSSTPG